MLLLVAMLSEEEADCSCMSAARSAPRVCDAAVSTIVRIVVDG